jgi:hypothetical protein
VVCLGYVGAKPLSNVGQRGLGWRCLAQVMLLAGLDENAKKDVIKGPHHGGEHISKLLKFLTIR